MLMVVLEYLAPWTFYISLMGLFIAVLADHFQLLAKYTGAVERRVAHGYNSAMKIMVVNRLGAVLYFVFISYNIDIGILPKQLKLGLSIAIFFLLVASILIVIWLKRIEPRSKLNFSVLGDAVLWVNLLATIFNILGLTIPWIAGAEWPEYRLTLANTSFLFNTIYTVVNVFYIEHKFAVLVDRESRNILSFVVSVTISRTIAFAVVASMIFYLT